MRYLCAWRRFTLGHVFGRPAGQNLQLGVLRPPQAGRRERESGAMPRGALRERGSSAQGCAGLLREVARSGPGRPGEIQGMRTQRATPRIRGRQKSGRRANPRAQAKTWG